MVENDNDFFFLWRYDFLRKLKNITFFSRISHGVRFDLRDGVPMGQLTREPLPTYELRVVDGMIEVAVA